MSKVKAIVLETKLINKDDKTYKVAFIQFGNLMPKKGDKVTVKWDRGTRSNKQNNLYWAFINFLFYDCDLNEEYESPEELHETGKASFLSKRTFLKNGTQLIKIGSTAKLDKIGLSEYMEKFNRAMIEYHNIDTSSFWADYEKYFRR